MKVFNVIANGTEMGTYTAYDADSAILAYVKDAGYESLADAAAACGQTENQFLADIEAVEEDMR